MPVLAWVLPRAVAEALNAEFGATFVGRDERDLDIVVDVDRAVQQRAIRCHASQSGTNSVLWRRLELLGAHEWLQMLSRCCDARCRPAQSPAPLCDSEDRRREMNDPKEALR